MAKYTRSLRDDQRKAASKDRSVKEVAASDLTQRKGTSVRRLEHSSKRFAEAMKALAKR